VTDALLAPLRVRGALAPSRVLFGPHATNLGRGRALSDHHVAYYARRARGGCGVLVTEVASVHESDWPYERAPLAAACAPGWAAVAAACAPHGAVVLAGLGHAGLQGSTAWTQDVLWAPSLVPSVATAEQPVAIGEHELAELVDGFATAAAAARRAGCHGVELNAGQHSLLRQFCSGLTNLRDDAYGQDRSRLLAEVLAAVRAAVGDDGVIGLRLCVDELAPWAGLTPELAGPLLAGIADEVDYACLVRGSIYSEAATQPDGHVPQAFNRDAADVVIAELHRAGVELAVCAQGSIVDVDVAVAQLDDGGCELVEMTRAQIADPDLVAKLRDGASARIRPCLLCNQHCLVRDPRNPLVSCCVNPGAGHELADPGLDDGGEPAVPRGSGGARLVVGGGVAGLEAARLLARRGHRVTLVERESTVGGALRQAAALPGRERLAVLVDWLERECASEGVVVERGREVAPGTAADVVATGAEPATIGLRDGDDGSVARVDAAEVAAAPAAAGAVVVLDPIGGPIGIAAAELVAATADSVTLVTPDVVVGSQLSATGDLVAANVRLAALGVATRCHANAVGIDGGTVVLEDRFTGEVARLEAATCVDAGPRAAPDAPWPGATQIGDAVAPRGILAAMLEARRAVLGTAGSP
jgi:mycofactocin system FadH/OYE family oxidoreductase 1